MTTIKIDKEPTNTDWGLGYINELPAVFEIDIQSGSKRGYTVDCNAVIENQEERCCWYLEDGVWQQGAPGWGIEKAMAKEDIVCSGVDWEDN